MFLPLIHELAAENPYLKICPKCKRLPSPHYSSTATIFLS